jgi:hypothetical protein
MSAAHRRGASALIPEGRVLFPHGAYVFVDTKHQPIPGQITTAAVAPVVSLMASHAVTTNWFARAIWDRVVSNYSRDADIWRLGFGRTF